MSALTDLFSSMANKIRSKTGTATTYTPPQMVSDGIDDVFDAGVASATTSITPSNSSPASMTANTGYKPTANGSAIASYSSVTPSNSSPASLSSGSIYKMGGAGKAVASVTTLTPSNSSPATIASGTVYKASAAGKAVASITDITPSTTPTAVAADDIVHIGGTGTIVDALTEVRPSNGNPVAVSIGDNIKIFDENGYAIRDYTAVTPNNITPVSMSKYDVAKFDASGVIVKDVDNVTPSDSSPASLTGGEVYKMGNSGYAIASSPASKTPSDSSPASVSSGSIIKPSAAGYLFSSNLPLGLLFSPSKVNQANISSSGTVSITVTQKPRYIVFAISRYTSGSTSSDGRSALVFLDITNQTAYRLAYTTSGYEYGTTTYSTYVSSASASSVVLKNPFGVTVRSHAAIYY